MVSIMAVDDTTTIIEHATSISPSFTNSEIIRFKEVLMNITEQASQDGYDRTYLTRPLAAHIDKRVVREVLLAVCSKWGESNPMYPKFMNTVSKIVDGVIEDDDQQPHLDDENMFTKEDIDVYFNQFEDFIRCHTTSLSMLIILLQSIYGENMDDKAHGKFFDDFFCDFNALRRCLRERSKKDLHCREWFSDILTSYDEVEGTLAFPFFGSFDNTREKRLILPRKLSMTINIMDDSERINLEKMKAEEVQKIESLQKKLVKVEDKLIKLQEKYHVEKGSFDSFGSNEDSRDNSVLLDKLTHLKDDITSSKKEVESIRREILITSRQIDHTLTPEIRKRGFRYKYTIVDSLEEYSIQIISSGDQVMPEFSARLKSEDVLSIFNELAQASLSSENDGWVFSMTKQKKGEKTNRRHPSNDFPHLGINKTVITRTQELIKMGIERDYDGDIIHAFVINLYVNIMYDLRTIDQNDHKRLVSQGVKMNFLRRQHEGRHDLKILHDEFLSCADNIEKLLDGGYITQSNMVFLSIFLDEEVYIFLFHIKHSFYFCSSY